MREAIKRLFKGQASKALIDQDPNSPQPRQLTQRPHSTTHITGADIVVLDFGVRRL